MTNQTNPTTPSEPTEGPIRGDSELDTGAPDYHQDYKPEDWPHGPEVAAAQKPNIEAARLALKQSRKS